MVYVISIAMCQLRMNHKWNNVCRQSMTNCMRRIDIFTDQTYEDKINK